VDHPQDLVPRRAHGLITEALSDTRVVTLNGARQAGKSTLARLAVQASPNAVIRLLDDPATLRAARDDPAGFVEHDGLMMIDEVQLAPELFRTIKVVVDTDPRPGRFLLTGSAQVLALRHFPTRSRAGWRSLSCGPSPKARSAAPPTHLSMRHLHTALDCLGLPPFASATTSNESFAADTLRRSADPHAAARHSSTPT